MHEQRGSRLFTLPPELRSRVYADLLCPEAPSFAELASSSGPRDRHGTLDNPRLFPALLSTCRCIHREAIGFLYELHTFHAHPSLLTDFPQYRLHGKRIICPAGLSMMKRWHLTVRLDIDPRFDFNQCTFAFSGVEYLELYVWQAAGNCDADTVLRLFEGIRGVKVARVSGSVDLSRRLWLESLMMRPL
jgi:hypothetical protein